MKAVNCRRPSLSGRTLVLISVIFLCAPFGLAQKTAVFTYHNDVHRTGWNHTETTLTPANVNATEFGLLASVPVDDEVDAVPLVIPNVSITSGQYQGVHDVVYVITASNTVYAMDASSGTVLLTTNLGTPVVEPLGCKSNGPNVGVNSTPVIDQSRKLMYVMAYTEGSSGPVYTLHALDIGNLQDKVKPEVVSATHTLTDGSQFAFNATYQRQRPALLEANNNVYAAFGSWCDFAGNLSRGWLLGWEASTLAPLPANQLLQSQASDTDDFFLASIWMSGYGPSADDKGNILFVTGNSDSAGNNYDGVTSIQESAVKVSPDLSTVVDLFTPDDWSFLDQGDHDFGSGGIMVLPDQAGSIPHLAVAAGKEGSMFLMNEDDLGGYSPNNNNVLGTYTIGKCFCGESYFSYLKNPAIVTSGANQIIAYRLITSPTPQLEQYSSATIVTGQDAGPTATGFFTSVSSNGQGIPIIWALSRPLSQTQPAISLYAFLPLGKAGAMTQLFSDTAAGTWPYFVGRYNQVPVVANGKVYVASYQVVNIYGLLSSASKANQKP